MIVMPSNNTGKTVKWLFQHYPDNIALLLNPNCIRPHQFEYRYAIDNAAFSRFDEKQFFKMLDQSKKYNPPMFVACPDVVGCHDRTLALWHYYRPIIAKYEYQIAFVAQDGCTPEKIPYNADWIFIGGKDPWKSRNIKNFIGLGKPVHVGRVNGVARLKKCEELGVDSVDGTGWMRAYNRQRQLVDWFTGDAKQMEFFSFGM
jgi:hypothetical protein